VAGMDGVEIHGVHEGMLIDQFAIALSTRERTSTEEILRGRLRFATEIVKEIKKKVGKDFPVGLRFSIKSYIRDWNQGGLPDEEFKEKGRDTEEGLEAAKILEEAGYDALDADAGSFEACIGPSHLFIKSMALSSLSRKTKESGEDSCNRFG